MNRPDVRLGRKRRIAVPIGDPAGIGCEVALKALSNDNVRAMCDVVLVGDEWLVRRCNALLGLGLAFTKVRDPAELVFDGRTIQVFDVPALQEARFSFGKIGAEAGRALIEYASAGIRLAQSHHVDSVVAGPQNQSSVRCAGIPFNGYSGFVASQTGTPEDDVFLLLASSSRVICHLTLHLPVRLALEQVTQARVLKAIRATDRALRSMNGEKPRIAVGGLNPHAGENGLFGHEDADEIAPAVARAKMEGMDVSGPFGTDVMFARGGYDAYVVMLHDQGHIPGKLEKDSAGFYIGPPVIFGSVAHGSAHDIAGRGIADPGCMVSALLRAAGVSTVSS